MVAFTGTSFKNQGIQLAASFPLKVNKRSPGEQVPVSDREVRSTHRRLQSQVHTATNAYM